MLTTLPTSRAASCEKRSTKGVSGGLRRRRRGRGRSLGLRVPGRGAAAVPGSGGGGVPGAAGLPLCGARLGGVGTALDCAHPGAAMMANSAHEAATICPVGGRPARCSPIRWKSWNSSAAAVDTSRSERGAPGSPLSSAIRRSGGRSRSRCWPFRHGRYEMALRMASTNRSAGAAPGVRRGHAGHTRAARGSARLVRRRARRRRPGARRRRALAGPAAGRTVVVGAGKASAAMARAFEAALVRRARGPRRHAPRPRRPLRPDRDRRGQPSGAGPRRRSGGPPHPRAGIKGSGPRGPAGVPDFRRRFGIACAAGAGADAGRQAGGDAGAARSGATIGEINAVRKHLSAIKGGRLAAAASPAAILTLAISDVPGDDPAVIASGPTVPDPTSFAEARAVLAKYGIGRPPAVLAHLAAAAKRRRNRAIRCSRAPVTR